MEILEIRGKKRVQTLQKGFYTQLKWKHQCIDINKLGKHVIEMATEKNEK